MSKPNQSTGGPLNARQISFALLASVCIIVSASWWLHEPISSPVHSTASENGSSDGPTPSPPVVKQREGSPGNIKAPSHSSAKIELVKRLAPQTNSQVLSAFESLSTGDSPAVTGPMLSPPAFDRDKYQAAPEDYLSVSMPGRVWQSAQPGPEVPAIETLTRMRHVLRKGESIRLQVRTKPSMPVSFMATDLGTFSNGLTSISLAADKRGVAEAVFTASSGANNSTEVLAASPAASGRIRFEIRILP